MIHPCNDFKWVEHIQGIVCSHRDVEVRCTSSDGRTVTVRTSSILLSAYSPVLRRSFADADDEDGFVTLLCTVG